MPVIVAEIFHQVQRSVAPTRIAAHESGCALGFLGSAEQELMADEEFFIAERIPTSSTPVGIRAYEEPTEVNPLGGQVGAGEGGTTLRTGLR